MNALSPEEAERFELHLFECERCRQDLANLQRAFHAMNKGPEAFRRLAESESATASRPVLTQRWVKYALAASLFLVFGYFCKTYFLDWPRYYDLALVSEEIASVRSAVRTGENMFAAAIRNLQEKNYPAAIADLEHFLELHPENYQANYYLGLAYLAAGQPVWWARKTFSRAKTETGIGYLQRALRLAGDNQFYQEACHWLLGKAWLRLGEVGQAKAAWQAIVDLPSPDLIYKPEARKLLAQMGEED